MSNLHKILPTCLLCIAVILPASAAPASGARPESPGSERSVIRVQDRKILVDGKPFYVKGIHYGPWRPKTGPNKGYAFPSAELVEQDLALIRSANANAILLHDPPPYVLDLAHKHQLKVLCTLTVNWWAIGSPEFEKSRQEMLQRVAALRDKPALLAWVLGNEIPSAALELRGEETIVQGLRDLYDRVRQLDRHHPVTHSNWPPTRSLDLSFLDFASFNLYPLWPPEVVARGYGNYIRDILRPVAGNRPLLISEFGVNTLEASPDRQAELLTHCWREIGQTDAIGGVVFELADEWWKNYDNPKRDYDWWNRQQAPDDELHHDRDPEEHYGLMTWDRRAKPAYQAVKQMFADQQPSRFRDKRFMPGVAVSLMLMATVVAWVWARSRRLAEANPSQRRRERD